MKRVLVLMLTLSCGPDVKNCPVETQVRVGPKGVDCMRACANKWAGNKPELKTCALSCPDAEEYCPHG